MKLFIYMGDPYKIFLWTVVPRDWAINGPGRKVKIQKHMTLCVDIFIGSRCLVRSIERAYISGWLLARRRERWRTSEIAEKRAEAEERRVGEGKWDTHATASMGCLRTDPAFNINDGHIDENGVGSVSPRGIFRRRPLP